MISVTELLVPDWLVVVLFYSTTGSLPPNKLAVYIYARAAYTGNVFFCRLHAALVKVNKPLLLAPVFFI